MKGVNKLIINEATVIEALQDYFNARASAESFDKVLSVSMTNYNSQKEFEVIVEEEKKQ